MSLQRRCLLAPLLLLLLIASAFRASAWGANGHRYTNRLAVDALPAALRPLYAANRDWIAEHSNDPDTFWKNQSRLEGPTHFIDLDTWGLEAANNFPQDYQAACKLYGKEKIDKNGTVPWRIGQFYGLLVHAFKQKDSRAVVEISAWLGHYAADSHVPFHAAANYDGQLTGQKGLHARFESTMVNRQIKFEDLKARPAVQLADPVASAFHWLRDSLKLSTTVLAADKEAAAQDPAYGDAYYTAFGAKSRQIAVQRLEEGAQDLASLWYSAWLAAGKPDLPASDVHAGEAAGQPTHDPTLVAPATTQKP
ncbi:MAG TPA: S1/P1 nuclease [Chthonomonadaceae bacterium]|nr:S1/P1 nuclease [Chthonomonadaceae bacterium]